jgi:hypothetical protein
MSLLGGVMEHSLARRLQQFTREAQLAREARVGGCAGREFTPELDRQSNVDVRQVLARGAVLRVIAQRPLEGGTRGL